MRQKYTNVQSLIGIVRKRKAAGETYREIAESLGLTLKQVRELVWRENRRDKLIAHGYVPQPKGRPHKTPSSEATRKDNELIKLRMEVDLLRNFLSEVGRR